MDGVYSGATSGTVNIAAQGGLPCDPGTASATVSGGNATGNLPCGLAAAGIACNVAFSGGVPSSTTSILDCLAVPVAVDLSWSGGDLVVSASGSTTTMGITVLYTGGATMQ